METHTPIANIDPKAWGPPTWKFVDYMIMAYPLSASLDQEIPMTQSNMCLGDVLPCDKHRDSFNKFVNLNPPETSGRVQLPHWFNAHKENLTKWFFSYFPTIPIFLLGFRSRSN